MSNRPLIAFATSGKAPILSYNVPEPISYFGSNIIELEIPKDQFTYAGYLPPVEDPESITLEQVLSAMRADFKNERLFPSLGADLRFFETIKDQQYIYIGNQEFPADTTTVIVPPEIQPSSFTFPASPGIRYLRFENAQLARVSDALRELRPQVILDNLRKGLRLRVFHNTATKQLDCRFVDPKDSKPRLAIVETYRLTSYLGDYGAGRVVQTFSLLPSEKARIAIQTYTKTTSKRNEASSILDSYSRESADDFERAVKSEQTDKQESQRRDEWHVDAQVSNNWGFMSAKLSAGYAGSASAGREQFARDVSNVTKKCSSRASNKRDIQIEQRSQTQVELGQSESSEREIHNLNTGRVLSFVFRQMNQEFISILHLIDAHVAFFDAAVPNSLRLIELPELERFLESTVETSARAGIVEAIATILSNVFDAHGNRISLVEKVKLGDGPHEYLRVRRDLVSTHEERFPVPGIILSASRNVLRTDGLIVEAVLGAGEGLDTYARGLQEEQVRTRRLANELLAVQVEREKLAQKLLSADDTDGAALFEAAFHKTSLSSPPTP
ncbi:MAG: hypothetical protein KDK70_19770 [Myxococcales bacterium]|nr:hypothetical protein [Myxococcales bacterium]